MRRTFLAAALIPAAVAMNVDTYFKIRYPAPTLQAPSYKIMVHDMDCSGRGPFARMVVEDDRHVVIYDFQPPKPMAEIRTVARNLGYDSNLIKPFVCD